MADVAVIGDSFVEAPTVADDEVLTSVLARLLDATVANLGMSDYGPQQELVILRRYALPLRPRLIVWAFYEGNDLRDVGRYEKHTAAPTITSRMRARLDASFTRNVFHALHRLLKGCQAGPTPCAQDCFATARAETCGCTSSPGAMPFLLWISSICPSCVRCFAMLTI